MNEGNRKHERKKAHVLPEQPSESRALVVLRGKESRMESEGVSDDINFGVIQDDLPPIPPKSSFEAAELRPAAKKSGGTMKYWILLGLLLVGGANSSDGSAGLITVAAAVTAGTACHR